MASTDAQRRDEEREREHLAETVGRLRELEQLAGYIDASAHNIESKKQHLWANLRDMDFAEKVHFRHEVDLSVLSAEHAAMRRKRIERLLESPYFGRVDFHEKGDAEVGAHYIGVHNFSDPDTQEIVNPRLASPLVQPLLRLRVQRGVLR